MQRTTLLIVVVALCLQDALVHSVTLEASNLNDRTTWGGNDVQLTCREGNTGSELFNAVFTRDGVVISTDKDVNCLPSDVTYCAEEQGSLLHFTASNLTEGIFACKNSMDVESNEIAIIAYPAEVFTQTELTGMWGMDLVLPCRYQPGPLTNSPDNYYQHTWTAILDGQLTSVSSNDNFQNNDNDFTLTIVKLNPILAMYDYRCGIDFLVKNELSQPYNLRDSTDAAPIHIMINESDGQASIVRSPSDVIVSAGEQATFTCTLSVTGNEKLQFQVFDTSLNDTLSGCEIDRSTNSRTDCSWPNDGINMTCDYSVPYEITCNLTLSGLTESSSTQVICSSGTGEGAPSATAGLAVRVNEVPRPMISRDMLSNDLVINFTLPAIPFVPLDVNTVLTGDNGEMNNIDNHNITSNSRVVEFTIPNSNVPHGSVAVQIRIKYMGDDINSFSELSEPSNEEVINPLPVPTTSSTTTTTTPISSGSPTTGGGMDPSPANHTVYFILAGFGALLLFIFICVLILALLLYRKRDSRSGKVELAGHEPQAHTPPLQIQAMKDMSGSYSGSRSHSPPDNMSNTNTTNTDVPEISPSHHSHNGSCCCRMDHSSTSEGSHRYLQVQQLPHRNLPRYGYSADDSFMNQYPVHPPSLNLSIGTPDHIPGINVQAPTPVTPANTEPFIPSTANTPEFADPSFNPASQIVRPGNLHIPSSSSTHNPLTPGTSTPISSEVALNIALYLMHKDCQLKDTCPTCRMIDNRFTKLLDRYETKAINKLAASSEVKSKLRHKHRPVRSPRTANALRPHLVRQRSMSTSHVNEDELTLSSTETEDDGIQTDMDKRRRTKEGNAPTRNFALLSLRDIPKDIVASDSELASTPSGRTFSPRKASSPLKNTRQVHLAPVASDSLSSNEDSQATDGSDTSSQKHNSHPDLNSQLPLTTTFLPNPIPKHRQSSTFGKYQSVVSTSGYSSLSDNESTVFRPVPSSRQGNRPSYSDESVDDYHSDGYSYGGYSYTDYPGQRSHHYQPRKASLDTVISHPSPNHYSGRHSLERSTANFEGNGHSQLSVHSANATIYSHHPQDRLGRPLSASPSHAPYKSGLNSNSGRPHARSMSPIVSLPTSLSRATPL